MGRGMIIWLGGDCAGPGTSSDELFTGPFSPAPVSGYSSMACVVLSIRALFQTGHILEVFPTQRSQPFS